ncbi:sulfurtransferase [Limnoglobus roseus]|uniref:sulfurtransferase n=1 Tax=Limnoglobus roseus TaxID=2598579 RepID=UPI0011EB9213|nr:rhodanese-like domain-containing protein [Limnoglobus roseus]
MVTASKLGLVGGAVLLLAAAAQAGDDYPHAELLVEPAVLASAMGAEKYVVLDGREKVKYTAVHVPAARWMNHAAWAKAFGDGDDAAGWSKRIAALGVGTGTPVVVYDDNHAKDAARVWWILRYWGVRDVRLLNGGWVGWQGGRSRLRPSSRPSPPRRFSPRPPRTAWPPRTACSPPWLREPYKSWTPGRRRNAAVLTG